MEMAIRIVNNIGVSDTLSELLLYVPLVNGTCIYCIETNNTYLWDGAWNLFDNDLFYENNPVPPDNTKQDLLVSGGNIKTINGASILGSGDVTISGSGLAQYQVRQLIRR